MRDDDDDDRVGEEGGERFNDDSLPVVVRSYVHGTHTLRHYSSALVCCDLSPNVEC